MRIAAALLLLSSLLLSCAAVPIEHNVEGADSSTEPKQASTSESSWSTSAAAAASAAAGVHATAYEWANGLHHWMSSSLSGKKVKKSGDVCTDEDWRKTSLKLIRKIPLAGLFKDLKGTTKWEASGTDIVNGQVFMIFDSLDYIGYTNTQFEYRAPENKLIGRQTETESSFEAIMYSSDTKTFLMVRETVPNEGEKTFSPSVVEARVGVDSYDILSECRVDFDFDSENKGFEGGAYFSMKGERYLLGLCEGNGCKSGKEGQDPGNGMSILTKLSVDKKGKCVWAFEKNLPVPPVANFIDYSDIAVYYPDHDAGDVLTVGIVSQESSAIWIGQLDIAAWEFVGPGKVMHFPRNDDCEIIFCNIEGISFLDEYQIITTTDRSKALQDYTCVDNDQSVQTFLLPEPIKVAPPRKPSVEL